MVGPGMMGGRGRLANLYACHRYTLLFYTLILTLVAAPLLTALDLRGDLLQLFLAFNLLVAVLGVPGRTLRTLLILLAAAALALRVAPAAATGEGLTRGAAVVASGLALVAAGTAVRF